MLRHAFRAAITALILGALGLSLGTTGCGFDPGCLAEGTHVATPSGPVLIEDLVVGDLVWSVDPVRGTRVAARVTAIRTARRRCLALRTASGKRVVATSDHPFYAPGPGSFVPLAKLGKGADPRVALGDGGLATDRVLSVHDVPGSRRVYDLTVSGHFHTFLADGVLVHNKSPASEDSVFVPIETLLTVHDEVTGQPATLVGGNPSWSEPLPPFTLTAGAFDAGTGVVHVESQAAFDTVYVKATTLDVIGEGHYRLDVASTTAADLRITLDAGVDSLSLNVYLGAGGVVGTNVIPLQVP